MINTKRFFAVYTPSASVSVSVLRVIDGYYLQDSDGTFGASVNFLNATEVMIGGYLLAEDRTVWDNGLYDVVFYDGGTTPISGYEFQIAQDQIMTGIALVALAAKNAVSQIAAGLKVTNDAISALTKEISLLQGQVNDYSSQSRRNNGN